LPFAGHPAAALAAFIHVNTTSDVVAGDGLCSLREAITATDNHNGGYFDCPAGTSVATAPDTIYFDVSPINITSQLPTISRYVHLDSYLGGPRAELHGPGSGTGLSFGPSANGTTIRNLVIDNFAIGIDNLGSSMTIASNVIGPNSVTGILVEGGTVTIGGSNPGPGVCSGDCNRISGNVGDGIYGDMNGSITGNLIGLDATGAAAQANGYGMDIGGTVTVGGVTADLRNVVSGNTFWGIGVGVCDCSVIGNYVGTDVTGKLAVPNGTGIRTDGANNYPQPGVSTQIGGENPGDGNVISGNKAAGILAANWGASDSLRIYGNSIGVSSTKTALGNGGMGIALGTGSDYVLFVHIGDASSAAGSNTIANNGGVGIRLLSPSVGGAYISNNSIHDNVGKGIQLLNGADQGITAPSILGTSPVHGTACINCNVDIYSDAADEGKKFEGSVVADGSGNWTFSGAPSGPNVTATARSMTSGTSEFSAPAAVVAVTRKPDGRIRKGSGTLIGNNVYNTTGTNQTKSGSASKGSTISFGLSIQNDGSKADAFKVKATGTTVAGYTVRFFHGTTDITSAVVAGTFQTPSIARTTTYLVTAKVAIGKTAATGSSVSRLVTITSVGNSVKKDAVKLVGKLG